LLAARWVSPRSCDEAPDTVGNTCHESVDGGCHGSPCPKGKEGRAPSCCDGLELRQPIVVSRLILGAYYFVRKDTNVLMIMMVVVMIDINQGRRLLHTRLAEAFR
jgi:hypothetical protein